MSLELHERSCKLRCLPEIRQLTKLSKVGLIKGFPSDPAVKNPPATQEMWVGSLGLEDPQEEEMAIHSSVLAWRIPWTEGPGGLQSMGSQRAGHD